MAKQIKTLKKRKAKLERIILHMEAKAGPMKKRQHKFEKDAIEY